MHVTNDIRYIGVDDHQIDLFEGLYPVPDGISYNSYVILDEKIAVMDAVDTHFGAAWLDSLRAVLDGRTPDYLIVHHMEPDHSASIALFMDAYPEAVIVASAKAFPMMKAFFGNEYAERRMIVKEGDVLSLGRHRLSFIAAPMVHWPEVIMTYDQLDQVLFSADGFGKFGALDTEDEWACEARRYYFGIVGKYGAQVQSVLKKTSALELRAICPLHGPVLKEEQLTEALRLYDLWSSYQPESKGVLIAHASVYGNTRAAAEELARLLEEKGEKVVLQDLNRCDIAEAVEDAFRYDRVVLAAATYNADVFPPMRQFITWLTERGYRNRTIGLIENGSWAPMAAKVMNGLLQSCKDITLLEPVVTVRSALNDESRQALAALAEALL
ncbi:MAG: FprA family A-type flavoprotein [Clostridia bacterium]|nr:FprA family A-type flavoprotein [Clostridia bacterium]